VANVIAENATPEKGREWWPRFLAALGIGGNVSAACLAAGIDRRTAYRNRKQFKGFARSWAEAVDEACDILEGIAWERASASSDLLLIFLLKANRPAKYRETVRQEHSGDVIVRVVYGGNRTDDSAA
jgi:hypothetical protein